MAKTLKREEVIWEEAARFVQRRHKKWLEYWGPYHDKCRELYRLYLTKQELTKDAKRVRMRLSLPFAIIETVLPEVHNALFDEMPYFKQKPVGPEDEEDAATVTEYIANQCERNYLKIKSIPFTRNRLMFGLSWSFIPWMADKAWKRRLKPVMDPVMDITNDPLTQQIMMQPRVNPMTGKPVMAPKLDPLGKPVMEKKWVKETVNDTWDWETLDNWDVVCDPKITDPLKLYLGEGQGVIISRYYSTEDLWKAQRDGKFINVQEYLDQKEEDAEKERSGFQSDISKDDKTDEHFNVGHSYKKDQHHILEMWGKFPARTEIDKNGRETLVYDKTAEPVECIINVPFKGNVCFRVIRNVIDEQVRPIIASNLHPQANRLVSPGFLEVVESEIRELYTFRNARLDVLTQRVAPMYKTLQGSNTALRDLTYRPFKQIPTMDPSRDLVPFDPPDLGPTYARDMGEIEYSIQNTTSALSASQGASNIGQAFGETATGINFFSNRIKSRLGMVVEVGEAQTFGPLSDIVNAYNQQFLTDPKAFSVINKPNVYLTIKPEAYMTRRDFIPVGAARKLSKGASIQLLDRMLTELKSYGEEVKLDVILRELLKFTELFPNPDKIFYTPEEKAQRQAQKAPDIKRTMSLSVNYADLPPVAKMALLNETLPQDQQVTSENMVETNPQFMLGQQEAMNG